MLSASNAFSGFSVDDLDRARDFYAGLGVEVRTEPSGLSLAFPDGHAVFVYPKPGHVPAEFTILNFPVDDIDAAVDRLAQQGVELLRYDEMPQDDKRVLRGRSAGRGPDIAWFNDPAGNILSVLQQD